MNMTITEFCRKLGEIWEKVKPEWLVRVATRERVLTYKELRLFAVRSARQVQHLMTDDRYIAAIDVAERYANGNATDMEPKTARDAARDAAREAAGGAQAQYLRENCKPTFER